MATVKFQKPKKQKSYRVPLVASALAVGAVIGVSLPDSSVDFATDFATDKVTAIGLNPNCQIKGNVSINSGERIYHVPGQEFYLETNISPQYGERYFCTEGEARRAGWRKARR